MTKPPLVANADVAVAETARRRRRMDHDHPFYKWVVLSNTTLGMLLASINASIVLISLPAIFRGIGSPSRRSLCRSTPSTSVAAQCG